MEILEYKKELCCGESVNEFFAGKDILVTGGSGFIGKVLIEKLLRSCPDIGTIYLILRSKKGVAPETRLGELTNVELFDLLKKQNPTSLSKLTCVSGDISLPGLGLSEDDRLRLRSVSVIFHSAATVRFDENLKDAVVKNLRATRDLLDLALEMKNLKAFMYVSTCYSNCNISHIEEKVYASKTDWRAIIQVVENLEPDLLNTLTNKILGDHPNTYTFSKFLAENAVNEYRSKLPVFIYRPSIVVSTLKEPFVGWMDKLNGPISVILGITMGVVRVVYMDVNKNNDYIPCDYVVNGLITAAYLRGHSNTQICMVANAANNSRVALSPKHQIQIFHDYIKFKSVSSRVLWYPFAHFTTFRPWYLLLVFLLHIIPGAIVDVLLKFKGVKFSLLRLYKKIFVTLDCLYFFTSNSWTFSIDNFNAMLDTLPPVDQVTFDYKNVDFDMENVGLVIFKNARKFVLKDDVSDEAELRGVQKLHKLYWVDRTLRVLLLLGFAWMLKNIFLIFSSRHQWNLIPI